LLTHYNNIKNPSKVMIPPIIVNSWEGNSIPDSGRIILVGLGPWVITSVGMGVLVGGTGVEVGPGVGVDVGMLVGVGVEVGPGVGVDVGRGVKVGVLVGERGVDVGRGVKVGVLVGERGVDVGRGVKVGVLVGERGVDVEIGVLVGVLQIFR
jgi:hypothetical protein